MKTLRRYLVLSWMVSFSLLGQTAEQAPDVPAADGVKLAVDILLPRVMPSGGKLPTLYMATRYWRSQKGAPPAAG